MHKLKIVLVGMTELPEVLKDVARALDADVITDTDIDNVTPGCGCIHCSEARKAHAEGRSPLTHPSIVTKDGRIRDVVRYQKFLTPDGDVIIFEDLFHPLDELNLYTRECERQAEELFQAKMMPDEFKVIDYRDEEGADIQHVRGDVEAADGRTASFLCIEGPTMDKARRERLQRAH